MFGKYLIFSAFISIVCFLPPVLLQESDTPGRSVTELREDSESLIKKSKSAEGGDGFTATVVDLCMLHREVVGHSKFGKNPRLDSVRARIGNRLKDVAKDLEKDVKEKKSATRSQTPSRSKSRLNPVSDLSTTRQAYFLDCLAGGPGQFIGYLPGNFAPPFDHGPELVSLIESTILPEFWQVNGGDGRIHYYQPLRILVVNGTTEVHESLTDLLRRMRQLGR